MPELYLKKFLKLKRGNSPYGLAPHKPILLISILQAFQSGLIESNRIYITAELVALFKSNWTCLVVSKHECKFALPFFHLTGDKFWHLVPNPGYEKLLKIKESIASLNQLNTAVAYAMVDIELYLLMKDKKTNLILQQVLLDNYFPETKNNYHLSRSGQQRLFDEIENKILKEDPADYKMEIKKLLSENKDEELFLRGSLFKREIPKIYRNACCISGMKITTTSNISMVDACHIVPFSESYDDTISNGLALCPNLHRAFDRGLISIDNNYKVIVKMSWSEESSAYSIRQFENKQINLPIIPHQFPSLENLKRHRDRWNY